MQLRKINYSCLTCGKSLTRKTNKYCRAHYVTDEFRKKKSKSILSYAGLHAWIRRTVGKAIICEFCRSTKNIQWANKSYNYRKDINDWIQLCQSCHSKFDRNSGRFGEATKRFSLPASTTKKKKCLDCNKEIWPSGLRCKSCEGKRRDNSAFLQNIRPLALEKKKILGRSTNL